MDSCVEIAPGCVGGEERNGIRSSQVQQFCRPNKQIKSQVAQMVTLCVFPARIVEPSSYFFRNCDGVAMIDVALVTRIFTRKQRGTNRPRSASQAPRSSPKAILCKCERLARSGEMDLSPCRTRVYGIGESQAGGQRVLLQESGRTRSWCDFAGEVAGAGAAGAAGAFAWEGT